MGIFIATDVVMTHDFLMSQYEQVSYIMSSRQRTSIFLTAAYNTHYMYLSGVMQIIVDQCCSNLMVSSDTQAFKTLMSGEESKILMTPGQ